MKMIIAIIGSEDADDLVYELNQHSFFVTKLSTMGGFLKKKSTTLMLGVEDERVEDAISIIKKMSGAREQLVYTPPTMAGNCCPTVNMTRSDEHESRRSNRICNKCKKNFRNSNFLIYITNSNYKRGFRLRVCPFLIPCIEKKNSRRNHLWEFHAALRFCS